MARTPLRLKEYTHVYIPGDMCAEADEQLFNRLINCPSHVAYSVDSYHHPQQRYNDTI